MPSIKEAVKNKGYETPTPIQQQAIPHLLEGKDLLGIAQTGTGKTAAFSLPILDRLGRNDVVTKSRNTRCLILTPTRELASQILESLKEYGKGLDLDSCTIFGGVSKNPQINKLKAGMDIIVATPGRLLDHIREGYIKFSQLEVFILDEADRMLDMGFINDVKKIIAKLPKEKQTLLFSATMPDDITDLANSLLKNPEKVEVTPQATTVEKIDQKKFYVSRDDKVYLLVKLLEEESVTSALVFSRTKHLANKIVDKLALSGIESAAIHGNKSQGAREKALSNFKTGKIRVLVATDIAARGIDIPQVSHVINFNPPEDSASYVHRIGRTARAGREGSAITFCTEAELGLMRDIEKFIRQPVELDVNQPFHKDLVMPVGKTKKPPRGKQRKGGPRKGGKFPNKPKKSRGNKK